MGLPRDQPRLHSSPFDVDQIASPDEQYLSERQRIATENAIA
jgi:hypothetical protein